MLKQIARGLSVSAETLYVRAGLLDAADHPSLTVEVIAQDAALTDAQRIELIAKYQEFQVANNQPAKPEGVHHD
jgi:hypothetical protein